MKITLGKAMGYYFLFLFVFMIIFLKFLGSSYILSGTEIMEKDGYCKIQFGGEWIYSEQELDCYGDGERMDFSYSEFRDICPKNKFFNTKFESECFSIGKPR